MGGQPHVPALRKRGRPTADERRARETEILTAALGVFLRSGYGASTVDELAAAAQVTKRTLYAYYGDKAEAVRRDGHGPRRRGEPGRGQRPRHARDARRAHRQPGPLR